MSCFRNSLIASHQILLNGRVITTFNTPAQLCRLLNSYLEFENIKITEDVCSFMIGEKIETAKIFLGFSIKYNDSCFR